MGHFWWCLAHCTVHRSALIEELVSVRTKAGCTLPVFTAPNETMFTTRDHGPYLQLRPVGDASCRHCYYSNLVHCWDNQSLRGLWETVGVVPRWKSRFSEKEFRMSQSCEHLRYVFQFCWDWDGTTTQRNADIHVLHSVVGAWEWGNKRSIEK